MPKKKPSERIDPNAYPPHMRMDYVRRNENIDAGKELCERCNGTGNQLFSMYQKCEDCDGKGYLDEQEET